jgi:hypothetical protein
LSTEKGFDVLRRAADVAAEHATTDPELVRLAQVLAEDRRMDIGFDEADRDLRSAVEGARRQIAALGFNDEEVRRELVDLLAWIATDITEES